MFLNHRFEDFFLYCTAIYKYSTLVKLYGGKYHQTLTFENHIQIQYRIHMYLLFMVIDVIRNIHIDTVTRMNHKRMQNIIRPIEKQKQRHLFQFWVEILLDGDRINFY
ncbi:uncharacterized protein LOC111036455 [Myzus persicae]|uniref:uncharacterized protein LOC111036455 n=1 Tax=Myzus persicae TaxID=13164 RepID=UPI000B935722|nr:uncharacterized protein LOC111036455 [Myzus persicae]